METIKEQAEEQSPLLILHRKRPNLRVHKDPDRKQSESRIRKGILGNFQIKIKRKCTQKQDFRRPIIIPLS